MAIASLLWRSPLVLDQELFYSANAKSTYAVDVDPNDLAVGADENLDSIRSCYVKLFEFSDCTLLSHELPLERPLRCSA
jgi:hypothetical protein